MSGESKPKKLTMDEIGKITDPDYLRRGLEYHDGKMVLNPARHGNKLYAEVKGGGKSNYKVTITFEEKISAKCTCISARRTAYCKHAIAVMVGWSKTPEAFVESEAPPFTEAAAGGKKKKASVKKGKTETREIQEKGIVAIENLLTDAAMAGLSAITRERVELVRELAEETRNYKLVRLSAALLKFADGLSGASGGSDFSLSRYAEDMTDILFTAKAIRKYWKEGAEDERVLEDLIGKTWQKKSLPIKKGLKMIEVEYKSYETPDNFRIDQSVFFCLGDGSFYSEKQILPPHLKNREAPKQSYAGKVIRAGAAYFYPGYPPARIRIEEVEENPVDDETMATLEGMAEKDWDKLIDDYMEGRRDVFAPLFRPALLRPARVICKESGLALSDSNGTLLPMPLSSERSAGLCRELSGGELITLFGNIVVGDLGLEFELMSAAIESYSGPRIAY